ncbi:hypothetical protein GYMLUDRAFT_35226 [Collybiopsis luxurians FD-317 M1]|nr:hypothetical protein GYMLUDRAFT_35226 [Collybiopsis luxurians FD-317 M1]
MVIQRFVLYRYFTEYFVPYFTEYFVLYFTEHSIVLYYTAIIEFIYCTLGGFELEGY